MNKIIIILISVIVIIAAVITAVLIFKPNQNEVAPNIETRVSEEILDECTDEYELLEEEKMLEANSKQERISPNADMIIKTFYKDCGHTKNDYSNILEDLVNKTEEELKKVYTDYKVEKFEINQIILYQESEGECNEHYIVREEEGFIVIFKILEDKSEEIMEKTNISTQYLTDTDKINMRRGIEVNGKQQLNQLIEDFE